ncbi:MULTISPECIES: arylesterase [Marivita]|uniref:Arylesterase n=1 Tax=Marivita cryptomonadis TaxID=505252 RepID=A0A9Q2NRG1_9RHOB|nr:MULTISPECIES: arylesterase [Marivita]MCR9167144.1 arylesterase [Paracoccaceae bacterium]MBM2320022.1 arylesterase [Marivita cryptomonadis]MBM2329601.1 arylesterase [Marivita cryptomonadis]MBM2339189.1 arylesterase [Marivita cryptomonadis]MBM2343847.1 arylesterase [Marivita cryptomonadis]
MFHSFTYGASWVLSKVRVTAVCLCTVTAAQAEPVEILALGDSLTAGYGLIDQEGFVPKMRLWLKEQGLDVRLVNAGVSGDTTAGGLSRVEWSLTPATEALIVALGGNDLLRGLDPAVSRANLEGILKVARDKELDVLIVGMEAPGNYGPDYKAEFDAMYPELAKEYGALYFPRFFEGLYSVGSTPAELRDVMQMDGIHPNAEGVDLIVAEMGPAVAALVKRASD